MRRASALFVLALLTTPTQAEIINSVEAMSNVQVIEHIRSELPQEQSIEERNQTLSIFDSLDSNQDNQVTFKEMRARPGLVGAFHTLDINNDGVLSRTELQPLQVEVRGLRNILALSALRII